MINIFNVRTNHPGMSSVYVAAPTMNEAIAKAELEFRTGHASNNGGVGYQGEMEVTDASFRGRAIGAEYTEKHNAS